MGSCYDNWKPIFMDRQDWIPKFDDMPCTNVVFGQDIKPVIASDYLQLMNKPSINGVTLVGDKSNEELLINPISNEEIEELLKAFS